MGVSYKKYAQVMKIWTFKSGTTNFYIEVYYSQRKTQENFYIAWS